MNTMYRDSGVGGGGGVRDMDRDAIMEARSTDEELLVLGDEMADFLECQVCMRVCLVSV